MTQTNSYVQRIRDQSYKVTHLAWQIRILMQETNLFGWIGIGLKSSNNIPCNLGGAKIYLHNTAGMALNPHWNLVIIKFMKDKYILLIKKLGQLEHNEGYI